MGFRLSLWFVMMDVFASDFKFDVMIGHQTAPQMFSWLWESACQAKNKSFFWLLMHDRLNTRNWLGRKNFVLPSY
jgi:hypothetical protein